MAINPIFLVDLIKALGMTSACAFSMFLILFWVISYDSIATCPPMQGHFEIYGNEIRLLDRCLKDLKLKKDDSEDVNELVSKLPIVRVDPAEHLVKNGKYKIEIENFIRCKGGSVPGCFFSPHVIQLLDRSTKGQLVFEKPPSSAHTLVRFSSLTIYKSWDLQLIDTLDYLHSISIVHCNLRTDNFVFSDNGKSEVVCDLESRWRKRSVPEFSFQGGLEDSR